VLKKFLNKNKTSIVDIFSPVTGKYLDLDEVPDPVFSDRMVGEGAAVQPEMSNTIIKSPVNGKIIMMTDTNHAIGIQDENGIELLIHIGLDTVELNGKGLKPLISINEEVQLGQPIMEVNVNMIEESGKNSVIPVVITNMKDNHYKLITNKLETVEAGNTVLFSVEKSY